MTERDAPNVDALAQEIRRVDGGNSLGAGALAEALMPFLSTLVSSPPMTAKDVLEVFKPLPESELAALREVDPHTWGEPSPALRDGVPLRIESDNGKRWRIVS